MFRVNNKDNKPNAVYIQGARGDNHTDDIASLVFQNYDDTTKSNYNMASVSMMNPIGDGIGALVFKTNRDGGSNMSEGMRLDYTGNLGIGASNVPEKLTVVGNALISGAVSTTGILIKRQTTQSPMPMFSASNQTSLSYLMDNELSTTATSALVEKTRLVTGMMPAGTYRIGLSYRSAGGIVRIVSKVDDKEESWYDQTIVSSPPECAYGVHYITFWTSGAHTVTVLFASVDGTTPVSLTNVIIEMWRVA